MKKTLKIAILGTRGIPARYGGFETFAEELSFRLVTRGHIVAVYGRRSFGDRKAETEEYQGVERVILPTIMHKYLETPCHAFLSMLHLFMRSFDIVLLCNAANSPFAWLVRLRGVPLVINVDGIERHRRKWSVFGKLWYRLGEACSVLFANKVVGDAKVISEYYNDKYGCKTCTIAYGARVYKREPGEILKRFGLKPRNYLLYVSRLEPENNALGVIEAYKQAKPNMPLVIVGDAPYAQKYIKLLKEQANSHVIFTGFQFGEAYQELMSHPYLYIQATEVGGTHPALVEAMGYGNCVIANGTPENMEVLGDAGIYYEKNDFKNLAEQMRELISIVEEVERYRELAKKRAEEVYNWDKICDQYEGLFYEMQRSVSISPNPVTNN